MLISKDIRMLQHIKRWGICPLIKEQSVAEHSYYVTCYTLQICEIISPKDLIWHACMTKMALVHDVSEIWTGDIPSTLNKHEGVREAKDLKTQELYKKHSFEIDDYDQTTYGKNMNKAILKIADYMEALHKCVEEKRLGNTYMEAAYDQIEQKLDYWMDILEGEIVRYFPLSKDDDLQRKVDQIISMHKGTEVNLREESATWGA